MPSQLPKLCIICTKDSTLSEYPELKQTFSIAYNVVNDVTNAAEIANTLSDTKAQWILVAPDYTTAEDVILLWQSLNGQTFAGFPVMAVGLTEKATQSKISNILTITINSIRGVLLGDKIGKCQLFICEKQHLSRLPMFNGVERFIAPLMRSQGVRIVGVPIKNIEQTISYKGFLRELIDCLGVFWLKNKIIIPKS